MDHPLTRFIEAARELLKAGGYFVDNLWHVDDVHFICGQLQLPAISNEEAMEVFVLANAQFDGETGISWPELERALRMFLQRREALAAMLQPAPADA